MELILGLTSLVLLVWWLLTPSYKLRQMGNVIPGPKSLPVIGNVLNFTLIGTKAIEVVGGAFKTHGPVFRVWFGPLLYVFLSNPDDLQKIFTSQKMISKGATYKTLTPWLGTGLLLSTGNLWSGRRKAITPTFHFQVLENCLPIFNKCADTFVSCLKEQLGKGPFDIIPYASNCGLDTISETAMGYKVEAQTKPKSEYVQTILKMTKSLSEKINSPWLALEPLYTLTGRRSAESKHLKVLHSLPAMVLREKRAALETSKAQIEKDDDNGIRKRTAFLELLLNIKNEGSLVFQKDQDIMDEVTTFMFEGHDTTTSILSSTIWVLGKHPEIQESVYQEIAPIIEQNPSLKIEHLQEMKYLERVIKEALRLYPPVPFISRIVEEDTTLPSGVTVPAGCEILLCLISLHRDPLYFEEPEKFNPDRFLHEQKHPYAYVPFSAGPRNCIGQKFAMLDLKMIIAQVVYNYRIATTHEPKLFAEMILRVENGLHITLTERNHKN